MWDLSISNAPPFKQYDVPGGGCMFDRYTLSACFEGAEVVSVAKMKNHLFYGDYAVHEKPVRFAAHYIASRPRAILLSPLYPACLMCCPIWD